MDGIKIEIKATEITCSKLKAALDIIVDLDQVSRSNWELAKLRDLILNKISNEIADSFLHSKKMETLAKIDTNEMANMVKLKLIEKMALSGYQR